jgi:hypothetical protein
VLISHFCHFNKFLSAPKRKIPDFISFHGHHFIFQVVTGGHYDVDVVLTDPLKNVLYKEERQHDVFG